ncbi:Adenylyltransferase and sulfurtransferase MOCS3-1 [Dichanthelium oligosanthes]|uniref:Adenylyltransferase and sulfurtransferase MOCS3-1 n=1 Tax=Dichanthelium oligosanthes TaxID=888268 RepID=A0A1E5UWG5_9POAL|nr:Adenylyltransferase and sulfurtransferase MOCS3-1 [Dichanthelium oligosanthes]
MGGRTEAIMREIASLRAQRDELDRRIRFFESQLRVGVGDGVGVGVGAAAHAHSITLPPSLSAKLHAVGLHAGGGDATPDMVRRYRRHLLLPEFGVQGCLGIVDSDDVELGSLHRQIVHIEAYVGQPKVKSAAAACRAINSSVKVLEYHLKLKPKVALDIVRQYDIVVDATNSVTSRYMLSDCCALLNKATPSLNLLPENARVTCREYKRLRDRGKPHLLLDVRPAHHFQIASIPRSLNIPLPDLERKLPLLREALSKAAAAASRGGKQCPPLYAISRRGNDSQVAVRVLRENGFLYASDVAGGLESWAREVDPNFLVYW